jgi:hypothetical protein
MQAACTTHAAVLTLSNSPAQDSATAAAAAAASPQAADTFLPEEQQQQQQQQLLLLLRMVVPLLLDQLLRLLLPLPAGYQSLAAAEIDCSKGTGSTAEVLQQQQQELDMTEAQQLSAVLLLQQLLAAGLLQHQDALLLLCLHPLQVIWQQQQQEDPRCRYSHSQLRLILQLTCSLIGVESTAIGTAAAATAVVAGGGSCSWEQCWADDHAQCICPLMCTAQTAAALAPINQAAASATYAGQQQQQQQQRQQQLRPAAAVKWLLLGLCQIQLQLQQAALLHHRPDYKASAQTAALLEALVAWLAEQKVPSLVVQEAEEQQQQQWQQQVRLSLEELQHLTWQQRLLVSCVLSKQLGVAARNGAVPLAAVPAQHSSSSGSLEPELCSLLLPDSLLGRPATYNSSSAKDFQGTLHMSQVRQLLLDCCEFAATSDAHALLLAQQFAGKVPTECAGYLATNPDTGSVAAALSAAVQQLTWQQLRQGLTLALGQFLPWASEHQAARVLLRLLPALLQATLGVHLQQQQQQENVSVLAEVLDAANIPIHGQEKRRQQQQQLSSRLSAALWCAELQLAVRAVLLFLQHGKWAQPTASAALNSSSSRHQARQLAAEQCFRHLSLLVLHTANQARQNVPKAAQQHSSSSKSNNIRSVTVSAGVAATQQSSEAAAAAAATAAGVGAQPSTAVGSTSSQVSFELQQVCVQELCRLAAALTGCVECSSLQVVLLQLLQQLLASAGSASAAPAAAAAAAGSASAHIDARAPPPPPPPPLTVTAAVAAAECGEAGAEAAAVNAGATVLQQGDAAVKELQSSRQGHAVADDAAVNSAAVARTDERDKQSGWRSITVQGSGTYGGLLGWVGRQLQLLPGQMQQLLAPAVVHMAEQQLAGRLGRSLMDKEVEELESVVYATGLQ